MNESTENIVHRYFTEIVEKQELEKLDEILHPDYRRDPDSSKAIPDNDLHVGLKPFEDRAKIWNAAFKSKLMEVEMMIQDKNAFAMALFKVKQIDSWFGLEPQPKEVDLWMFNRFVIKDEKIFSIKTLIDYHKFWCELGHSSIFQVNNETDYLASVKRIRFNS